MNNSNLADKKSVLLFFQHIRNVILNRVKNYLKYDKERLRQQARDKYRNSSDEKKNEKRKYGRNRYQKRNKI